MQVKTSLEILEQVMHKMVDEDGKQVTINCWASALALTDDISDKVYENSLGAKIPAGTDLREAFNRLRPRH